MNTTHYYKATVLKTKKMVDHLGIGGSIIIGSEEQLIQEEHGSNQSRLRFHICLRRKGDFELVDGKQLLRESRPYFDDLAHFVTFLARFTRREYIQRNAAVAAAFGAVVHTKSTAAGRRLNLVLDMATRIVDIELGNETMASLLEAH